MARKITFEIPGGPGIPSLTVTASEQDDGTLLFELSFSGPLVADIRGLFFDVNDPALVGGLVLTGTDVTGSDTGDVIDLGLGNNMRGGGRDSFDAGMSFGQPGLRGGNDDIQSTSFTLAAGDGTPLTLDLIANVEFGARLTSIGTPGGPREGSAKTTVIAPAAPDAIDDDDTTLEDTPVVIDVLDNDTDADGDALTITEVTQGANGTVAIVGNEIVYTPDTDFGGDFDTFTYTMIDNNGGTDWANVEVFVEAVADVPDVSVEAFATDDVNVIRLVVTAEQTDDDGSEFIDRIFSSALPAGVTLAPAAPVDPAGEPLQLTQEYLLTLPLDQDNAFELTFTAVSEELSNGDQETGSATIEIDYEANSTLQAGQFFADDQSIWSSGAEFVFDDERFFGVDTGPFDESFDSGAFTAGINGDIRIGFESDLHFEGGSIDATADYDVTVETNYNKTVDELLIETGALLTDTFFTTEGPIGSYTLDFVWDIVLNAFAGVDIDLGEVDLGVGTIDFGSITETLNVPIDIGPGSLNILDLDNETAGGTFQLPPPADAFSVDFAWPNITTTGDDPLNPADSSGASNNFLQLNLDVDELVSRLAGFPVNPFNPTLDVGPFFADFDILNVFVNAGLNFLQEFEMAMGDLAGLLMFEDGSNSSFTIGDSLGLSDASLIDFNGDDDGFVEFDFILAPASTLDNLTELGFNVGGGVDVLSLEVGYDLSIDNPFSPVGPESFGFSDSVGFGPVAGIDGSFPVAAIEVFNDEFDLAFQEETFQFMA